VKKIHVHSEQFDGHWHAWCGRGDLVVSEKVFAATEPTLRCRICEKDQFPNGQPEWHRTQAVQQLQRSNT